MSDDKYIAWVCNQIDGCLSPEERKKLEAYLAKHPSAKKTLNDQVEIAKLLGRVEQVEPSPSLKKQIMNSVGTARFSKASKTTGPSRIKLRQHLKPQAAWGLLFAMGVLVGIALHSVLFNGALQTTLLDGRDVIGTIGTHERGDFEIVERIRIDREAVRGVIENKRYSDHIGCEVDLQGLQELEVMIRFEEEDFRFKGLALLDQSRIDLENEADGIRAKSRESARYVLFFQKRHPGAVEYTLTLSQDGKEEFKRVFHFVPPGKKE